MHRLNRPRSIKSEGNRRQRKTRDYVQYDATDGAVIYLDCINGKFLSAQSLGCGFALPRTGAPVARKTFSV